MNVAEAKVAVVLFGFPSPQFCRPISEFGLNGPWALIAARTSGSIEGGPIARAKRWSEVVVTAVA